MKTLQTFDRSPPRRPTFKPLLEDALQVLKGPLHNPEAKDFRKIVSVMKNCYFFRENFSSQVALSEFVELAKFYVGYEVCKYGDVLLHDKEYADKLCVILDGTVEKISQKPYGEIEEQIKDKRRGLSLVGFERNLLKSKTQLPSIILPSSPKRISTPKANSVSIKFLKLQRLPSQERDFPMATLEDEEGPNFEDLVKFIVKKSPEMRKRYYAEDILRADQVKTLTTGDYFGESFCVPNHPKSNHMYAVSSPEAHLLTLSKEDYCEIMKQLEARNYKKLEAFINLFPSFEKEEIQRFSQHFSQKNFQVDEVIYFQDAPAQDLYIVQSGGVEFLRKSEFREGFGSSLMPIVSVGKDQAFGEEFLLLMDSRQETAIANASNTTVFVLKAALISELEEQFEALFAELKKRAEEKFQWRQKKTKELCENSEDSPRSPSLSPPKSQVLTLSDLPISSFKDIHGLYSPRHSIQIPYRRSFRSEKSLTYSISSANSTSSTFSTGSVRRLSDGQLPQQAKKTEIYKSRFGRTTILSDTPRASAGRKASNFQTGNLSPISDLKTMNFRKELYGNGNSSVRSLGRFEKVTIVNSQGLSQSPKQSPQQRVQKILNIHTNYQSPFQTLVIKRVQI